MEAFPKSPKKIESKPANLSKKSSLNSQKNFSLQSPKNQLIPKKIIKKND